MCHGASAVYVSKKLNHVGLNAFHNEYMAMCECAKHVVWLRQLLGELEIDDALDDPTVTYGDNNSALNLTVEDFVSTGNQYVYLPYHYNKEVVALKYVNFQPKASKANIADSFTKPVSRQVMQTLLPFLVGDKFKNTTITRNEV